MSLGYSILSSLCGGKCIKEYSLTCIEAESHAATRVEVMWKREGLNPATNFIPLRNFPTTFVLPPPPCYLNSSEPQVEGGESEDANLSKPQVKDKHVRLKVINDIVIESWGWPTVKQIVIKPLVSLRLGVLKDQNRTWQIQFVPTYYFLVQKTQTTSCIFYSWL